MIIARAGELLLIGLTTENVRRLEAGEPISLGSETHIGVFTEPIGRIGIFVGETERHIVELFHSIDAISDETKVIATPRTGRHGDEPS
ncbi:MAG TPA: hypothetical protein VGR82_17710 [Methylomirabilota bacterium]|nr:hypothetical protein [Methylomirabilota bacterium]